jgi:hypothetical protein
MHFAKTALAASKFSFRPSSLMVAAAIAIAVSIAAAPAVFATEENEHQKDLGPGCAPERPAIAHHAGGVIVKADEDERAPLPCVTATGFRTSEVAIVVTNNGTILFEPALVSETTGLPIGVLRSVDLSASWEFIDPSPRTSARLTAHDTTMAVDRQTGRVFWNSRSASSPLPVLFDDAHVFTGPPTRSLKHLMQGYPNVVYLAVSGGFTCIFHGYCGTHLTKSLDGGATWSPAVALPYPPECPSPGVFPTGGYLNYGVVGRDGTVYLPFTPCERPYIAISHDEGATWQLVLVNDTETTGWGELPLGMDAQGNLYVAWTRSSNRLPYLAISQDRGLHWSAPLMIGAPGVREAAVPQLVAGARGQVAIAYYGSKDAPLPFPTPCAGFSLGCPGYENETWDTYVTETWNAQDRQPLFWSAQLNDPAQPTWYGVSPSSMRVDEVAFEGGAFAGGRAAGDFAGIGGPSLSARMDYFGATMAPDGTVWIGFVQECPHGLPVLGNPNCPSTLAGTAPDGAFGMVGRLVRRAGDHNERHHDADH